VQSLVHIAVRTWSDHPVTAAASAVWIQVGIGLLLLVAPRGRWSEFAGAVSALWGLVVWVFGEAFGGIFAPGLTWLFGAPGAALFYVVAGVLVALPEARWSSPRLGRGILASLGVFYLAMAILQAWPGRGFWQGQSHSNATAGTLTTMVRGMAATPQPSVLSHFVASFASLDATHGFGVNLVVVVALAAIGAALCIGRRELLFPALVLNALLCAADWVLVEDFGFLGGVGTDPNTMVPLVGLCVGGYLALTRPAAVTAVATADEHGATVASWRKNLAERPAFVLRSLAALGALALTLLGALPVAAASLNPVADPILTEAIDGTPSPSDTPLLPFRLEDQDGRVVTAASLRGKAVALTFLDPVCTTDCPLIAQEFRQADALLGSRAGGAEFIAIVANPLYRSLAVTRAFDATEGLANLKNWRFLTGSTTQLSSLWDVYGVQVAVESGGAMVSHADLAYLIDTNGHVREILNADPGNGTAPLRSSFAGLIASGLRPLLPR
jgi:cytochrome oxidase Cu insertion factor (SCO1/SenC/PrrC family)